MIRTITFIPLLPEDEYFRSKAITYVDDNLQYCIQDLKLEEYDECFDNEVIIFFSEVVKCLIATDIRAKTIYYRLIGNTDWRWNTSRKLDYELEYRETNKYSSTRLIELEMKLFEDKKKDMEIRVVEYSILSSEDILRLESSEPPIRFVACLSDSSDQFIGMVYISFEDETINIYGIRTTIFGLARGAKGVAKSLLDGIFQYAQSIEFQKVKIIKTPVGPMEDILLSMGFAIGKDKRYVKDVDTYNSENILNIMDLGCNFEFLNKDRSNNKF